MAAFTALNAPTARASVHLQIIVTCCGGMEFGRETRIERTSSF